MFPLHDVYNKDSNEKPKIVVCDCFEYHKVDISLLDREKSSEFIYKKRELWDMIVSIKRLWRDKELC